MAFAICGYAIALSTAHALAKLPRGGAGVSVIFGKAMVKRSPFSSKSEGMPEVRSFSAKQWRGDRQIPCLLSQFLNPNDSIQQWLSAPVLLVAPDETSVVKLVPVALVVTAANSRKPKTTGGKPTTAGGCCG